MTTFFLICATIGGTILICQFVLSLVGLGHSLGDIPHDMAGDFHGDVHGGDHADGQTHEEHANSSWLFGVISFRTLVAAFAFFGLAGLAAESAKLAQPVQLTLATAAGLGAMFGVHWIMRSIYRLGENQTVRIQRAVGEEATVYVPIPADRANAGKVQIKLQNRLMEYEAVTAGPNRLATGTKVRVVSVHGSTLEVEPLAPKAA